LKINQRFIKQHINCLRLSIVNHIQWQSKTVMSSFLEFRLLILEFKNLKKTSQSHKLIFYVFFLYNIILLHKKETLSHRNNQFMTIYRQKKFLSEHYWLRQIWSKNNNYIKLTFYIIHSYITFFAYLKYRVELLVVFSPL